MAISFLIICYLSESTDAGSRDGERTYVLLGISSLVLLGRMYARHARTVGNSAKRME